MFASVGCWDLRMGVRKEDSIALKFGGWMRREDHTFTRQQSRLLLARPAVRKPDFRWKSLVCLDWCFSKFLYGFRGQGCGWEFQAQGRGLLTWAFWVSQLGFWECHILSSPLSFKGKICFPLDTFLRFITFFYSFSWPKLPRLSRW